MAITTYTYSVATDITGGSVAPAQLNDECVTAGEAPEKITWDHADVLKIYIDDATSKATMDPIVLAHVPA